MSRRRASLAAVAALAAACAGESIAPLPADVDLTRVTAVPSAFQRGMNLEPIGGPGSAPDLRLLPASLDALAQLGVDHVAVVPGFIQERLGDTAFRWRGRRERVEEDTRVAIRLAHERGLAVLLKPHLWLGDGDAEHWRGDIDPAEADWPAWSAAYREAMLGFARMAQQEGVAALSLGSELVSVTRTRPQFWRQLTAEVRGVFAGELTYAANWHEEFERIEFWSDLDYVGVDAFWPLGARADEDVRPQDCRERLQQVRAALQRVADRSGRPLLLTEIGYRSARGGLFEPWRWHDADAGDEVDLDAQAIAYACFAEVFGEAAHSGTWLRGAYVWNWAVSRRWSGSGNADFTPRGKPAQRVLQAWFGAPAEGR